VKTFKNVTLEVTPRMAEKISVAQNLGSLSLSLRSIADNGADLERAVAAGDVKIPANASPAEERQMLLAMSNRPNDSNTTFSTGGDVSRFQRSTVPGKRQDNAEMVAKAMGNFGKGLGQAVSAAPVGPVVRVARGNNITVVPVGAR
jgi:pilus assembly protein CpaB